ncbi:hypothetical protein chiPu_0016367 [Chiloscyllium punctatum]|uniref:Uncharacterized protein n=1 Tax=Chiloscyllium punctatum TaxID=137246 RepID=A0A401T5E6_CHIPU|nr:hypothetical protein [Chiloscyllium punctatum]
MGRAGGAVPCLGRGRGQRQGMWAGQELRGVVSGVGGASVGCAGTGLCVMWMHGACALRSGRVGVWSGGAHARSWSRGRARTFCRGRGRGAGREREM